MKRGQYDLELFTKRSLDNFIIQALVLTRLLLHEEQTRGYEYEDELIV